jgi:ubiquinone/menaquinone biosynthesis C-methylase UbiE
VKSLLDAIPAGRALDAACGTGRHTECLCARGFDTIGVDVTPEMLAIARRKAPSAKFVSGDLTWMAVLEIECQSIVFKFDIAMMMQCGYVSNRAAHGSRELSVIKTLFGSGT